ncbi:MAG TPA: MFS transporter, partial [Anaerolineae bacterium]
LARYCCRRIGRAEGFLSLTVVLRRPSSTAALAVVAFGVFVAADDLTVIFTMLRPIIFDLEIPLPDGLDQAPWIVNAYLIAYIVVMPFIGRLSDIAGRRTVYVAALVLFLAGSIWIPFATDLNGFIAGRVLTAIGGGAMVPMAMAVAVNFLVGFVLIIAISGPQPRLLLLLNAS